jgi:predicted DNA-binding protein (UPF0251 family)
MTEAQFQALAQLLRLRQGQAQEAVRLHLVAGLTVPDAARQAGVKYQLALKAVKRAKDGHKLAIAAILGKMRQNEAWQKHQNQPQASPCKLSRWL